MPDDTDPVQQPRRPVLVRWLLIGVAVVCLALGVVGLFLPVVPTVPFVLIAAWAAARSSPRLSAWMEQHPHMGPHIRAWRLGGVVPRRAKWLATVMMAASASGMLVLAGPRWPVLVTIGLMAAVALWMWLRPEMMDA